MGHVLSKRPTEVAFTQGNEAVQALGANRQDKPLGERVQVGALSWKPNDLDAIVSEQGPELGGVERVAVQNQKAFVAQEAVDGVRKVSAYLNHPATVGVMGDPGDLDPVLCKKSAHGISAPFAARDP